MPIRTLNELFLQVAGRDQPDCVLYKQEGEFRPLSAAELARRVRRLHRAMEAVGVERGDRIALMAGNGPHWPIVDFATLTLGAVLTPVYPSLSAKDAAFIIADCGAKMVFVQGTENLRGLLEQRTDLPEVERFVAIGGGDEGLPVGHLEALLAESDDPGEEAVERRAREIGPDDLATLIYTSGTTGRPKGVMLTHGNIASNVSAALKVIDFRGEYTALSFLPLSHSLERTVDYCYFERGVTVAYAESVETLSDDLTAVRPHVFVSVPRVYEKALARIRNTVAAAGRLRQGLFAWAESVGRQALPHRLAHRTPGGSLGLRLAIADRLVFRRIRQRFGGRLEFAVSGGAPLAKEVAEFFWAAGIRIYEGYGLTETSPILTVNRFDSVRLGTVGPAIPGVELRIAEDGEILARGPNVMLGYYGLPDDTAAAIDEDGWFHTGDIGRFDDAWHLEITDRKKEIIVNAYGKNIAPTPIEQSLKSSQYVAHAVLLGDERRFVSALLVPDFDRLRAWLEERGRTVEEWEQALEDEAVIDLYRGEIERVNRELSEYETIKAWDLLADDFTVEGGELTPTQKVKRRVVKDRYADLIDRMYERAAAEYAAKGAER